VASNFNAEKLALLSIDRKPKRSSSQKPFFRILLLLLFVFFLGHSFPQVFSFLGNWKDLGSLGKTEVQVATIEWYRPYENQQRQGEILTASGYIVAQTLTTIESEVVRKLAKVYIQQGQEVEAHQILAELEPEEWKRDLAIKEQEILQNLILETKARTTWEQFELEILKVQKNIAQIQEEYLRSEYSVQQNVNLIKEIAATKTEKEILYQQGLKDLNRFQQLYENKNISLEDFEAKQNNTATLKSVLEGIEYRSYQAENTHQAALSERKVIESKLEVAQTEIEILKVQKKIAEADLESVSRQNEILKAQKERLLWEGEKLVLKAPWKGVISSVVQPVGTLLSPSGRFSGSVSSTSLCEILDPLSFLAEADIAETYIRKIEVGQKVLIRLDAFPDEEFTGKVFTITPTANKQKAAVQVKVQFTTLHPQFLHQMALRITFLASPQTPQKPEKERIPVLLLPQEALLPDGNSVWVYKNEKVQKRTIQVGNSLRNHLEILTGLSEGEQVVLSPLSTLEENQTVRILKEKRRE
jgi:HlyD family secretion protein